MDFWSRVGEVQTRFNVLDHSLYQRWSAGELTMNDLSVYASEYRHAVVALADMSAHAASASGDDAVSAQLAAHAGEEAAHVSLWDGFATAVGADLDRDPTPETLACVGAWSDSSRDLAGDLISLYAIESAQPEISRTKAAGLRDFYGLKTGSATAYFDLHAQRDVEHAEQARELLNQLVTDDNADSLVNEAERVLRANWTLLDGVERIIVN